MCDKADEHKYDLEMKHNKNKKEIEELSKRVVDIKCKFEEMMSARDFQRSVPFLQKIFSFIFQNNLTLNFYKFLHIKNYTL